MGQARIALPITHRVRTFLRVQGADMRPWSGLDETYAGLYELLRERRDDPEFWGPLSELLESVLAGASDAARQNLPAPNAELLGSWNIEELVRDLRAALQRPEASSVVGFASRLPQAAMGAFLVLGLVAAGACASRNTGSSGGSTTGSQDGSDGGPTGDDGGTADGGTGETATGGSGTGGSGTGATSTGDVGTGDTGTHTSSATEDTGTGETASGSGTGTFTTGGSSGSSQTDTTSTTLPGWAEGCDLDPDSVLFQTIDESDLSDYSKQDLCNCFAGLNADWNAGLTELFETETPEVIAAVLQEMLECCWWDPYTFDGDFAQSRDDLLSGDLCFVAPPYRGVTFPHGP